ncbi:MAG: polyprenyl synthetase family protein [Anaerolineales bacterium]|nr:polyprenyl synthetase family protein [Anaerolineales bacterium]
MRRALFHKQQELAQNERSPDEWMLLPGLSCQAAGGEAPWADDIAAGWFLFYAAAHIMDAVEDHDAPDSWWEQLGAGGAINVASGMFFSASLALHSLDEQHLPASAREGLIAAFYRQMITMCSGQHMDLFETRPRLANYWRIAEKKSGVFFGLACQAGARLATDQEERLEGFRKYGRHFGILIQVLDDLEEWRLTDWETIAARKEKFLRSLPVVYAREVLRAGEREEISHSSETMSEKQGDFQQVLRLVEQSGAPLYLMTEIERHTAQARLGLDQGGAQGQARATLETLLNRLVEMK